MYAADFQFVTESKCCLSCLKSKQTTCITLLTLHYYHCIVTTSHLQLDHCRAATTFRHVNCPETRLRLVARGLEHHPPPLILALPIVLYHPGRYHNGESIYIAQLILRSLRYQRPLRHLVAIPRSYLAITVPNLS
jgi:hypothetical protein